MKKLILTLFVAMCFNAINVFASSHIVDSRECPVLIESTDWEFEDRWGSWGKRQFWTEGRWEMRTGVGLYTDKSKSSTYIQSNLKNPAVLVYIGPWQKTTLTKGPFWNQEKTEVEIRMIASQKGPFLERHYEIKDEENSKITEQKFAPLESPDDIIPKCDILWVQKYGYNAVYDCSLNPLRWIGGRSFNCSGKVIDVKTKKILADFSDQIEK